jgi:Xaa-Pro aminopeptidase
VFLTTEQHAERASARREEVADKLRLLRAWLEGVEAAGIVLTGADSVAWLAAGLTSPIERGAATGPLRIVVTAETAAVLTTNVERARLEAEASLDVLGLELHEAPWFDERELDRRTLALADSPASALTSDRPSGFGRDCGEELIALRLALSAPERERLAGLARDTAAALEQALHAWQPGESDRELQARVDAELDRCGAFAPCLIVGGDERVLRFRHPLAAGAAMTRLVMAVAVAERDGLHAAATRFACAGGLPDGVRSAHLAARAIETEMLAACRTGTTYGEVMLACERAYRTSGHAGAWRDHYQGGPIGYRQREFEIVPSQRESRWFETRLEPGHALAWNPSVSGGGKAEDTYLLEASGLVRLTETGAWPLEGGRPAILDIGTGAAA